MTDIEEEIEIEETEKTDLVVKDQNQMMSALTAIKLDIGRMSVENLPNKGKKQYLNLRTNNNRDNQKCYGCGERGHIQRFCNSSKRRSRSRSNRRGRSRSRSDSRSSSSSSDSRRHKRRSRSDSDR